MTDLNRQLIDYAQEDNAVEFRQSLYASIHDKVTAHIEAQKQQLAQRFFEPKQQPEAETTQEPPVENA